MNDFRTLRQYRAKPEMRVADLYGAPANDMPTRDEYQAQIRKWCDLTDRRHTPAELAAIQADQARRVKALGGR